MDAGPDDIGADRSRGSNAGSAPVPVAALDELVGCEPGSPAAVPVASFDAEQVGTVRADVPVADLGEAATRRAGRRLWAAEAGLGGATGGTDAGGEIGGGDGPGRSAEVPVPGARRTKARRRGHLTVAGGGAGAEAGDPDLNTPRAANRGADAAVPSRRARRRDRLTPEMSASVEAAARAIRERVGREATGPWPTGPGPDSGPDSGADSGSGSPSGPEPEPDADPVALARTLCLRLLTERARSRHELALALRRKGVPEPAARVVLDRLDEVGLVDDAAFAEQWVHSRHTGKGLGRRALAVELRRKGVADDVAGNALQELDVGAEEQRARGLVDRKLRGMDLGSPERRAGAARRLAGMLARKGYGSGIAYRVVREAIVAHGAENDELAADGEGDD